MGKGKFPEELTPALICREMGWTWQEYETQPDWFIQDIILCRNMESLAQESQVKKAK